MYSQKLVFFPWLIFFYLVVLQTFTTCNPIVQYDKFMVQCEKYDNLTMTYRNVSLTNLPGGIISISYIGDIREKLDKYTLLLTIQIQRCRSKESPDSCMSLTTIRTDKFCDFMSAKAEFWTAMVTCVSPKMQCPLQKKKYYGRNCRMNMESFKWFPLQNSYWKFLVTITDKPTKKVLACLKMEGRIINRV